MFIVFLGEKMESREKKEGKKEKRRKAGKMQRRNEEEIK